jgi:ribosome-associated protein
MACTGAQNGGPTDLDRRREPAARAEPRRAAAPPRARGGGCAGAPRARAADRAIAEDKKAADIVLLELGELTTLADYFVICSGGSERQIDAIADAIAEGLRAEGTRPIGREGAAASHWVLLDYGSVIVHVFTPPERDYYQLERHWAQARTVLRVQ